MEKWIILSNILLPCAAPFSNPVRFSGDPEPPDTSPVRPTRRRVAWRIEQPGRSASVMDFIDRLECVYYPGPIPSSLEVLNALCLLYDKVHFPGAYLPLGDYDRERLVREIERLSTLNPQTKDIQELVHVLSFLETRQKLDGILEYPTSLLEVFGSDEQSRELMWSIAVATSSKTAKLETRHLDTSHSKALPGGDAVSAWRGHYAYQAGAIRYAREHSLPLLDDCSGIPLPFRAQLRGDAKAIAATAALESVSMVLDGLPMLPVSDLLQFREENAKELRNYRAAMLRCANAINAKLPEEPSDESLRRVVSFYIDSEILPALHELKGDLNNPNRSWRQRAADLGTISATVFFGFLTGGIFGTTLSDGFKQVMKSELDHNAQRNDSTRRNGLYYLLQVERLTGRRS